MDEKEAVRAINDAWEKEGSIRRLGLLPSANKAIQEALIPSGGDWQCVAQEGAISRTIVWWQTEVALINPRGDLADSTEGDIAMGMRATPVMDKALRAIFVLAQKPENLELIGRMARAAIDYAEQPAPRLVLPDEDEEQDDDDC